MKGYVYILKKDLKNKFYIGSTIDINRRMRQHKTNHTHTTRRMAAPELVLLQEYDDLETARKIEKRIKRLKRKDYIAKMVSDGYIKISA